MTPVLGVQPGLTCLIETVHHCGERIKKAKTWNKYKIRTECNENLRPTKYNQNKHQTQRSKRERTKGKKLSALENKNLSNN